jgi:hypothetical protein
MQELIDVFRMTEVSAQARIKIIIQLGQAINNQFGANLTEGLVYELVKALDPSHELLSDPHYQHAAGVITMGEYREKMNWGEQPEEEEEIPF